MPWRKGSRTTLLSCSPPYLVSTSKTHQQDQQNQLLHLDDANSNNNDYNAMVDLTARRLERQRKLRHLREVDLVGVVYAMLEAEAARKGNCKNRLSSSSSPSPRALPVMPEPQPLPLPELSTLLKRDGYTSSKKVITSSSRFSENGRFKDGEIGGLNQSARSALLRNSRKPSRNAPENLKFVDVESNRFSLRYRSAPTSPYAPSSPSRSPPRRSTGERGKSNNVSAQRNQIWSAPEIPFSNGFAGFPSPSSPSRSPPRRSTGDMVSSNIMNTQQNQIWSAPEMPFSNGFSGFPFSPPSDQIKCSTPDSSGLRGNYIHRSLNARKVQLDHRNSRRSTSPKSKRVIAEALLSPQAYSYTNVHPLPLPPGASSPSSILAPTRSASPVPQVLTRPASPVPQILTRPASPVPQALTRPASPVPQALTRPASPVPQAFTRPASPVPQVPTRTEFSSAMNWQKGKLIGRGTFGSVYVATNLQTGALCAMKEVELIHDDPKSDECIKQLEQEIKLLSQLQHPNIVQYYGSQIVDDKLYIFLEYVHPGSISKYIRDHHCGAITEAVVRNFTRHILSGLAYLHSQKTVHRDIKGANLLVDSAGVVKLADFGMAKHLTEAAHLSLKGSPYWMAPELLLTVMQKDTRPDLACAVDIWSLGCTIIEMLNGKPPWSEYEGAAAMFKVIKESPGIPETLSPEGKDFLQCCFQRNPADRPTANTLLDHPFLRNSQPDIQSCINGLNAMNIKDRDYSSEVSFNKKQERLLGANPLKAPESSLNPLGMAASSAQTL